MMFIDGSPNAVTDLWDVGAHHLSLIHLVALRALAGVPCRGCLVALQAQRVERTSQRSPRAVLLHCL